MSTDPYFPDPGHSQHVVAALDELHRALTRRWREEVCRGIVSGSDFSLYLRSDGATAGHPLWSPARVLPWDHTSIDARRHLEGGDCAYVRWVATGQQEDLSTINCDGRLGSDPFAPFVPPSDPEGQLAGYVDCGMGKIMEQVEQWAWEERQHVFQQIPLFDGHNLRVLNEAHDTFLEIGARLGLEAAAGSHESVMTTVTPVSNRSLPEIVHKVSSGDGKNPLWWDSWTGLAASSAKDGFFASVEPTLSNQSVILGALANLYSARGAIINKGRNDTLAWIQWAAKSLDQTAPIDITDTWVAVQGVGTGMSVAFGWSGVGSFAGSVMRLVGFLGHYVMPEVGEAYVHDLTEVVGRLNDGIAGLNREIGGLQIGYAADINRLCERIHGVHSYNLELYDVTRNDPDRDRPASGTGGVSIEVDEVLRLAERCYTAGELYADLLPLIEATTGADGHLADDDGHPTLADRRLLEVRDQIAGYLQTSAGRYLVAADQVTKAVRLFVEVDTDNKHEFEAIMADWDRDGVGRRDPGIDPTEYAMATERPWTWSPPQEWGGTVPPGTQDPGGQDYVTDEVQQ